MVGEVVGKSLRSTLALAIHFDESQANTDSMKALVATEMGDEAVNLALTDAKECGHRGNKS